MVLALCMFEPFLLYFAILRRSLKTDKILPCQPIHFLYCTEAKERHERLEEMFSEKKSRSELVCTPSSRQMKKYKLYFRETAWF